MYVYVIIEGIYTVYKHVINFSVLVGISIDLHNLCFNIQQQHVCD